MSTVNVNTVYSRQCCARFVVLTVMPMEITVFWNVAQ